MSRSERGGACNEEKCKRRSRPATPTPRPTFLLTLQLIFSFLISLKWLLSDLSQFQQERTVQFLFLEKKTETDDL